MIHDEHHRALVRRLAAEVKPTRRLWPISVRLALWMALEMGILMWVMTGSGSNVIGRLKEPAYTMEVLFFGFAAVILATLALRSAIPGRYLSTREATHCRASGSRWDIAYNCGRTDGCHAVRGRVCASRPAMRIAHRALLGAAFGRAVVDDRSRRLDAGRIIGLLAGGSAVFFAMTILRLECPNNEPMHILIWHLLPALALAVFSALAGSRWLKFRSYGRRRRDGANDRTQPVT